MKSGGYFSARLRRSVETETPSISAASCSSKSNFSGIRKIPCPTRRATNGSPSFSVAFRILSKTRRQMEAPLKCLQRLNEGRRLYFAIGVKDLQKTSESLAVPIAWDEGDYVWIWASRSLEKISPSSSSSRRRALKLSINPFSHGLPGVM